MQELITRGFTSSDRQVCDMDCLNCKFADCINDCKNLLEEEIEIQNRLDEEIVYDDGLVNSKNVVAYIYRHSPKGKAARKRYCNSDEGKMAQKRYMQSDKGKETQRRYEQSEKGRARADKYVKSEKGKAAQSRYAKSEKGKERNRKATRKRVESGKNAEYCRRYRERKKAAMAAGLGLS